MERGGLAALKVLAAQPYGNIENRRLACRTLLTRCCCFLHITYIHTKPFSWHACEGSLYFFTAQRSMRANVRFNFRVEMCSVDREREKKNTNCRR